jgi:hypothetical protein
VQRGSLTCEGHSYTVAPRPALEQEDRLNRLMSEPPLRRPLTERW